MKYLSLFSLLVWSAFCAQAQNPVYNTFQDTRVINAHSVETLEKGILDFRVTHRFGDMAANGGGIHTLFGVDNAADIYVGFEYGIDNKLMIGAGRYAGAGQLSELYSGFVKYRILHQTDDNVTPISLSVLANTAISGQKKGQAGTIGEFSKVAHRMSYFISTMAAYQLSPRFSFQAAPKILYRNYVHFDDSNLLGFLGLAVKANFSKKMAIIIDYDLPFQSARSSNETMRISGEEYYHPLSIGVEYKTLKHVFVINFSNNGGILANDYLAYNAKNWLDGGFRFGFTISRDFKVAK